MERRARGSYKSMTYSYVDSGVFRNLKGAGLPRGIFQVYSFKSVQNLAHFSR